MPNKRIIHTIVPSNIIISFIINYASILHFITKNMLKILQCLYHRHEQAYNLRIPKLPSKSGTNEHAHTHTDPNYVYVYMFVNFRICLLSKCMCVCVRACMQVNCAQWKIQLTKNYRRFIVYLSNGCLLTIHLWFLRLINISENNS